MNPCCLGVLATTFSIAAVNIQQLQIFARFNYGWRRCLGSVLLSREDNGC